MAWSLVDSVSRTCEQGVRVLLVVFGVQSVVASRLEDVVEELAALLAVLHRVLTFHHQQQGHQVGHSYWSTDYSGYNIKEKKRVRRKNNGTVILKR